MSKFNSQANARLVFENAQRIITGAKLTLDVTKLTNSDLRLEQQAATNKTQYQFPVLVNNNGPANTLFNTEIRLNQQDSFVASAWGFFISKPSSATDATYILHTYPSPLTFSTTGVAAAAETLYNSIFQISVNNDIVMPVMSTRRFRAVPQSQAVAAAANQNGVAYDQIDLSSDGFMVVEPLILFIGSKNTVITLSLPAAMAVVETNQRLHVIFEGVLAQNSTIIT
jgi:hypothetical protein